MTLPVGITTATVTFGKALGMRGTEATIEATVVPDRPIIWSATGDTIYEYPEPVTSSAGGFLTFQAPHVDQAGFIDETGAAVTNWAYVLEAKVIFGSRSYDVRKPFQVLVGQTTVDLDLVPGGTIVPSVSAPLPEVLSVAGRTGTVSADDLKDELDVVTASDLDQQTADLMADPGSLVAAQQSASFGASGALTLVRNPITGWYHADNYGVQFADDDDVLNTAVLQDLLDAVEAAGGGTIWVPAVGDKVAYIDDPLVVGSSTTVLLAPDMTIKLKQGSTCNMLVNRAALTARTVMDGAISAGDNTLNSATAAFTTGEVGDEVYVWGAGRNGQNLRTTIASRTSATSVELTDAAEATVTDACVSIGTRDHDIIIEGGCWDRGADTGGGFFNSHTLRFRRVDGLTVRAGRGKSQDGKFWLHYADATVVRVHDLDFDTDSDGVHGSGPLRDVKVSRITGTTGDDFVAHGCDDYVGYNDTYGPIVDLTVEDLDPVNSTGSACRLWAGPGHFMGDVNVRRVRGTVKNSGFGLNFSEDPTNPRTVGGTFGVVTAEDISTRCGSSTSGNPTVFFGNSGTFQALTIDGVDHKPLVAGVPAVSIQPASGGGRPQIKSLKLGRSVARSLNGTGAYLVLVNADIGLLAVEHPSMPDESTSAAFIYATGGTVDQISVTDPDLRFGDVTSHVITLAGATVKKISWRGGAVLKGRSLVDANNGTPGTVQVAARDVRCTSINRLSNVGSPMEWDIDGSVYVDTPANPLFYLGQSGSTLRLRGANPTVSGTYTMLQKSATQAVTVSGPTIRVDIDKVTHQLGDSCHNTNASASSATGTGPKVSTGSAWLDIGAGLVTPTLNIQAFTANGTWNKPSGVSAVDIVCIGAGGGGGSGMRGAGGGIRGGGGGGASGGYTRQLIQASLCGATETVTVGAGGTGGAAVTADSTNGNAGVAGGASSFGSGKCRAGGGGAGQGGTSAGGVAGAASFGMHPGVIGAAASATGGAGASGTSGNVTASGAAGGGITAADSASNGGAGGSPSAFGGSAGSAGTGGAAGGAGASTATNQAVGGAGGGGGGASITAAAGAGGNGGNYGAGGGGGGASLNGNNSGKGGDGASGICLVVAW